ncbi:hypothetical protein LPR20_003350, partial [Vibrio mimicus]
FNSDYNKTLCGDGKKYIDIKNYTLEFGSLPVPKLVLEDIEDDKVYRKVVDWKLKNSESLNGFSVFYEAVHGGGNRTANICRYELSRGSFTFSICDSDKKTPMCDIGDTAKLTKAVFLEHGLESQFLVLDAHEVENLLPINILMDTARNEQKPALHFLEYASELDCRCYQYYDMKNGNSYKNVYNMEGNVNSFWFTFYDSYAPSSDYLERNIKNDSFVMFNTLSSMLPHAIEKLSLADNIEPTPLPVAELWNNIGEQLINWFITANPIRV